MKRASRRWTAEQRQRYNLLREREHTGTLTQAEHAELAKLMQQLRERETASMAVANEQEAEKIAALESAVEQLEAQNRQLREYLHERQAFLARARALVAEIQAEDRRMRERFADVLPLIGEPSTRELS